MPACACFACFAYCLVFLSAGVKKGTTLQYLPRRLFDGIYIYTFPLLVDHPDQFSHPHILIYVALLLLSPPCPARLRFVCRINKAYYLPRWCSTADYVKYFEAEGLVDIKRDDWTDNIQVLMFDNERTPRTSALSCSKTLVIVWDPVFFGRIKAPFRHNILVLV